MTIALGVVCDGGVVLGTDLQYTIDSTKMPGQKMFSVLVGKPNHILMAAAGSSDSAKQVVSLSESLIYDRHGGAALTAWQIKACIEEALRIVYLDHIDPAPESERAWMHCDFLVAIRGASDGILRLFSSNRTRLIEEKQTRCLGIGLYFSNYALASLLPMLPSTDIAAQVVSYVIALASDYVEGVGKGSDVHILHNTGIHDSLMKPEKEEIVNGLRDLFRQVPELISCCDRARIPDEGVPARLERAGEAIKRLRDAQKKRDAFREKRAKW